MEFLQRFLLHVLPHGFHKIRHYGLCSSHHVTINTIGKVHEMLKPAKQRVAPKPCAPAINSVEERAPAETWAECLLALTVSPLQMPPVHA
jgi:hypothetical protein